jgi:hypothetical protein
MLLGARSPSCWAATPRSALHSLSTVKASLCDRKCGRLSDQLFASEASKIGAVVDAGLKPRIAESEIGFDPAAAGRKPCYLWDRTLNNLEYPEALNFLDLLESRPALEIVEDEQPVQIAPDFLVDSIERLELVPDAADACA